jgi:hypothetical protein
MVFELRLNGLGFGIYYSGSSFQGLGRLDKGVRFRVPIFLIEGRGFGILS